MFLFYKNVVKNRGIYNFEFSLLKCIFAKIIYYFLLAEIMLIGIIKGKATMKYDEHIFFGLTRQDVFLCTQKHLALQNTPKSYFFYQNRIYHT
jgi:hypothetical protein